MDSDVQRCGRLIDQVDSKWREDKLPDEDIAVPLIELPDPEPDNGNPHETLKEQEQKWTDLGLNRINDQSQTGRIPSN
ncbi:anaphase-promoting complex subunit 13 [Tachypleus tridentatus]|uniref:anaphase-promoting complex subunit 13 n=1 Tax=Tachypleus tridentatus TaxID=6853 RepID=UPI003FD2CCDB